MNKEKFLRVLIWILLALMLIVVVHDRYVFHDLVYNKAVPEIVEVLEQAKDSCSSFCHCRHHNDSIVKSQLISSSAGAANTNNIRQTVNVIDNSDSLNEMIEDVSSLFSLMKDVDGLISANGLTFLISLIVALLIALVTDRIGDMEKLRSDLIIEREKDKKEIAEDINTYKEKIATSVSHKIGELDSLKGELERDMKENREYINRQISEQIEKNNTKIYGHLTNYDMLLTRVESLFNLAITIGSVTKFMPLSNADKTDAGKTDNQSLFREVGILCSRLSLLCDPINDILNGSEKRIEYLSENEKNILLTYLADTQNELEKSQGEVKSNQSLHNIIGNKRRLVKNIYDMIDAVKTISEDNR